MPRELWVRVPEGLWVPEMETMTQRGLQPWALLQVATVAAGVSAQACSGGRAGAADVAGQRAQSVRWDVWKQQLCWAQRLRWKSLWKSPRPR